GVAECAGSRAPDLSADETAAAGGDDPVEPAAERAGQRVDQLERPDDNIDGERAGKLAADLRGAGRREPLDQATRLGRDLAGEAVPGVRAQERPRERVTVASMLVAVERQHARTDDPGGGEVGVVGCEPRGVAHD